MLRILITKYKKNTRQLFRPSFPIFQFLVSPLSTPNEETPQFTHIFYQSVNQHGLNLCTSICYCVRFAWKSFLQLVEPDLQIPTYKLHSARANAVRCLRQLETTMQNRTSSFQRPSPSPLSETDTTSNVYRPTRAFGLSETTSLLSYACFLHGHVFAAETGKQLTVPDVIILRNW